MSDPFVGPTMTPTPVLPSQWQTDAQDVHNAILDILTTFTAAYPGYIRQVRHALPQSITAEGPFLYLGRIREALAYSGGDSTIGYGLVQTRFEGEIGYVDVLVDPEETDARILVVRDALRQLFVVNARVLPAGIFQMTTMDDGPELQAGTNVRLTNVLFGWQFVILRGDRP